MNFGDTNFGDTILDSLSLIELSCSFVARWYGRQPQQSTGLEDERIKYRVPGIRGVPGIRRNSQCPRNSCSRNSEGALHRSARGPEFRGHNTKFSFTDRVFLLVGGTVVWQAAGAINPS
jgi:hypothetical protein